MLIIWCNILMWYTSRSSKTCQSLFQAVQMPRISFSCHTCPLPLLWHEFDNGLWNFRQYKVSCCLHMYFLWRHHLPPNKSENDQNSDSGWFKYCIDIWLLTLLFSLQYFSESCFGGTICLPTNRKMIKIVTLIDSHIVLTYDCWHCFPVSNISVSHALEMKINFSYPTQSCQFCFSFTQPFTHSKFCFPNPFLFGATPCHK
jgi:hypothetical protein